MTHKAVVQEYTFVCIMCSNARQQAGEGRAAAAALAGKL